MSRRLDSMLDQIATGSHDVWSIGPFKRPSTALRRVSPWLRRMEDLGVSPGSIAAVEDIRLIRIGHTWWIEVQFDNASEIELASNRELCLE